MATLTVVVRVRVAWWFGPYVRIWMFFCQIHEIEPDGAAMMRLCERAIRIDVRQHGFFARLRLLALQFIRPSRRSSGALAASQSGLSIGAMHGVRPREPGSTPGTRSTTEP
jgi:hypothetical protein